MDELVKGILIAKMNMIRKSNNIKCISVNEEKRIITVVFEDKDVQLVRCLPTDEFDIEIGVALAIARHQFGSRNKLRKTIDEKIRYVAKKKKNFEMEMVAKVDNQTDKPFLKLFLKANNITNDEAAEKCGVSRSAISRARSGYCMKKATFNKIVKGLGLTEQQAEVFKKSLTLHQHDYRND